MNVTTTSKISYYTTFSWSFPVFITNHTTAWSGMAFEIQFFAFSHIRTCKMTFPWNREKSAPPSFNHWHFKWKIKTNSSQVNRNVFFPQLNTVVIPIPFRSMNNSQTQWFIEILMQMRMFWRVATLQSSRKQSRYVFNWWKARIFNIHV